MGDDEAHLTPSSKFCPRPAAVRLFFVPRVLIHLFSPWMCFHSGGRLSASTCCAVAGSFSFDESAAIYT